MTLLGWAEIALTLELVFLAAFPVGRYLATLLEGGRTFLSPVLAPVEGGSTQRAVSIARATWAGRNTCSP